MIVQWIIVASIFLSLLANTYHAGKGEFKKTRNDCIHDVIFGTILLILAIGFWNL